MYSDDFVQTTYGMHLIYATPGDAFDKPTFKYSMTYDSDGEAEYTIGLENNSDTYTFLQLVIYAQYRFSVITYGNGDLPNMYGIDNPAIPDSLQDAYDAYFNDIHDGLYVVGYLNTIVADQMLNGQFVNEVPGYCSTSQTDFDNKLQEIRAVYAGQLFSDYDHID